MLVWIDLANSPHVPLFAPVVRRLRESGASVLLTARDHAQTLELARSTYGGVEVVGTPSPRGVVRKGAAIAGRSAALHSVARLHRPDVALSHGSYAQILAARAARVPSVTMMDYEFQPANHVSFRLANRVVVPSVFPEDALRRFGARAAKVVRYDGFKEELYLSDARLDPSALASLELDPRLVTLVMRPAPEGALYHRDGNERFEGLLALAARRDDVQIVYVPRTEEQARAVGRRTSVIVPDRAIDGLALLLKADLMIGAGGTMNREAALLGTPTYTVFAHRLAAVDEELIRRELMHDLRDEDVVPRFEHKTPRTPATARERADALVRTIVGVVEGVAGRGTGG